MKSPKEPGFFYESSLRWNAKTIPSCSHGTRYEVDLSQGAANQTDLSIGYTVSHSGRCWGVEDHQGKPPAFTLARDNRSLLIIMSILLTLISDYLKDYQ